MKAKLTRILAGMGVLFFGGLLLYSASEYPARKALDDAGMSTKVYWDLRPSWSLKTLVSRDRKVTSFEWVPHYPSLESVEITQSKDNVGHIRDLKPLARINNLKKLRLSGVHLESLDDLPVFAQVEDVELFFAIVPGASTPEGLERLKQCFPKIRRFYLTRDEYARLGDKQTSWIIYNDETGSFEYRPAD